MRFSDPTLATVAARMQPDFAAQLEHWRSGRSTRVAKAIANAGARTTQEIAARGRGRFNLMRNVEKATIEEIAHLTDSVDGSIDDRLTPQAALTCTISMMIADADEVAEITRDCISSLIRAGSPCCL